jgi:hypothetical protein
MLRLQMDDSDGQEMQVDILRNLLFHYGHRLYGDCINLFEFQLSKNTKDISIVFRVFLFVYFAYQK